MMRWISVTLMALLLLPVSATAELGFLDRVPIEVPEPELPGLEVPVKIPGLTRILRQKPALTTSLADARTGVPFLDDFEPRILAPMTILPRSGDGGFILAHPGLYQLDFLSYCLHAGAYGPGRGDGYLWAPLKGSLANVIRNVLRKSVLHPEIPQQRIQVLLWSILARTKVRDLPADIRQVAQQLLTKREISRLNGGALGNVPPELFEDAFGNLPPLVRQSLEAEAQLRGLLAEGVASFDELAGVAVLPGDPPPPEQGPLVPEGRWSYQPTGFFVRYFPSGYRQTRVEIYVPEHFTIERDQHGRIILVADEHGNRIETDYDDSTEPVRVPGDPDIKGYVFSAVRFVHRKIFMPEIVVDLEAQWARRGWTLVGVASGGGQITAAPAAFPDLRERYEWAVAHKDQLDLLHKAVAEFRGRRSSGGRPEAGIENAIDLGHYALALKHAISNDDPGNRGWVVEHIQLLMKAWQAAVRSYVGTGSIGQASSLLRTPMTLEAHNRMPGPGLGFHGSPIVLAANDDGQDGDGGPEFGAGGAQPGAPGRQRLGLGGEDPSADDKAAAIEQIAAVLAEAEQLRDAYAFDPLVDWAKEHGYDGYEYNNALKNMLKDMAEQGYSDYDDYWDSLSDQQKQDLFQQSQGVGGAESPMHTDGNTGQIVENWTWEDYVRRYGSETAAEVIRGADRAHERHHQDTYKRESEWVWPGHDAADADPNKGQGWPIDPEGYNDYMSDPENYSRDEVEAYSRQMEELQDWLDHDC